MQRISKAEKDTAKYIAITVRGYLEGFHAEHIPDSLMPELNRAVRNGIMEALYCLKHMDEKPYIRSHMRWMRNIIPPYWEEPEPSDGFKKFIARSERQLRLIEKEGGDTEAEWAREIFDHPPGEHGTYYVGRLRGFRDKARRLIGIYAEAYRLTARHDGKVVGYCSYDIEDGIAFLLDIQVAEGYRRAGIATELLWQLAKRHRDLALPDDFEGDGAAFMGSEAVYRRLGWQREAPEDDGV